MSQREQLINRTADDFIEALEDFVVSLRDDPTAEYGRQNERKHLIDATCRLIRVVARERT